MRVDFWVFGLQVLGVSTLVGGLNFATTILNMRAEGMKMMRLPLFSWMTLVTSFLIIRCSLSGGRLLRPPHRVSRLRRVSPPHVRHRDGADPERRVLGHDDAARRAHGREDLIVTSFGILVLAAGALIDLWVVVAGFALTLYGIFRWALEPAGH